MKDGTKIVVEWLLAAPSGTALNTLVGTRVGYLRVASGWTNTTAAVMVRPSAMTTEAADVQEDNYAIHCFGGSADPTDAEAVFQAVHARMQGVIGDTATGGIVTSFLASKSTIFEPDTGYPAVIAIYNVRTT